MSCLEIDIRDEQKIIAIWLSKAEQGGPNLSDSLRKIYAEYSPRKYTVVVFKSSEEDLCDLTSGLLLSNRRKLAKREMEEERAAGPSMIIDF